MPLLSSRGRLDAPVVVALGLFVFLLGWFTCMRNACESRRWERHAQCVEWHRMEQEKVLR